MEVNNRQPGGTEPSRRGSSADDNVTGSNRQRARRAELEAQPHNVRGADQEPVHGARAEHGRQADRLELSHASREQVSPAREARLRALTEAYREGSLNSPERLSLAAEKLLLG